MTYSYVSVQGVVKNNRKVVCKTTDEKPNGLGLNSVEGISVDCLCQKSDKTSYDGKSDKIAFSVNRPLYTLHKWLELILEGRKRFASITKLLFPYSDGFLLVVLETMRSA